MEVNVKSRLYRDQARERLTSERGLLHRSRRPIEPEAVFGQIKYDGGFKRFHYRGKRLVGAEFATLAIAHNIRKIAMWRMRSEDGSRQSPREGVSTLGSSEGGARRMQVIAQR